MFQHFKFRFLAVKRQIQHQQYFALLAPLGTLNADLYTVSALHQNSGGIGKFIPNAQEGRGGGFPNPSHVLVEYGHSIQHQGVHGIRIQGRIDSVKSNPSH